MINLKVETCASSGVAIGEVYIVKKQELLAASYKVTDENLEEEIAKYEEAVRTVKKELEEAAKTSDIFAAHIELVQDSSLATTVNESIKKDRINVEEAVAKACDTYIAVFESMEDEYMRERATDLFDIKERLLYALKGEANNYFTNLTSPCIIVATDLTPSDTIRMDTNKVLGFVMQYGGVTSHVSIIAKNLGLPALVGVSNIVDTVKDKEQVILDATNRQIILSPDVQTLRAYKDKIEKIKEENELLNKFNGVLAITKDKKHVEVCANVGSIEDIKRAKNYGFDGIGLFRSEFLYMENTHFPTEEEQFEVYKEAVVLAESEVTVRTLDIGGDKGLPYFSFETEENPFLGWRAIRICLERKDIFKTQLRALLRASVYGKIRIMYPMIVCEEELDQANQILAECRKELEMEGLLYDPKIKVGIMIETPAAVFCAKELAAKSDFFSIGTNDLTQYITAVDRGNKKVEYLYNTKSISVLRAIKQVINAGHEAGITVGMCGEFASDASVTKLLLGMGLDEFSMSASCINKIKSIIIDSDYKEEMNSHAVKSI